MFYNFKYRLIYDFAIKSIKLYNYSQQQQKTDNAAFLSPYRKKDIELHLQLCGFPWQWQLFQMLQSTSYQNKYTFQNQDQQVAIKIVELNSLKSKKLQELLFSQIEVLKEMNHPNVLRCFEVFTSNRNCYIITQLCNEGDLQSKFRKKKKLEQWQTKNIVADVYKGLKYLGSKNIIHRDLKIANIFVHNGVAKIADFGFALHCKCNFKDLNIGSPLYMAPEGVLNSVYGPKTDVWSFGIMIFELFHGQTPFNFCQTEQDLRRHIAKPIQWNQLKQQIPNQVKQLILSCLQINQQKRPTIHQLINNSYIQSALQGREQQTNRQLRFKSPLKTNISKQESTIEDQHRNHSKMKVRSAFSTQNQSLTDRSLSRNMSPNKTFFSSTSAYINNVNSTQNNQNIYFEQPNKNSNFLGAITLPVPVSIRRSITSNERQQNSNMLTVRSPLTLAQDIFLNKTQSSQTNISNSYKYLISAQINFKESVSLLHYCRLIFKYLQCYKDATRLKNQNEKEHYAIFGNFLILIMNQICDEVVNKKIKYQGQNPQMREKKLNEVTEEYRRKYNAELDKNIITQFSPPNLQSELTLNKIYHLSHNLITTLWVNQNSNIDQIIVSELLLTIYSSSVVLEECYLKRNYTYFQKYKQIEDVLNKNKDSFTCANFIKHKNKILSSKIENIK